MAAFNILEKTTYSLKASELGAGKVWQFWPALNIPVGDARELVLLLRLHEITGSASGSDVTVAIYNSAPSRDDPAKVFRATSEVSGCKVTVAYTGTTYPYLGVAVASSGIGEAVDLSVTLKQASAPADINITMSVDLVVKNG